MDQREIEQPVENRTEINDDELDSHSAVAQDSATQIYQCKTARKSAKANVTRKMNEIDELIGSVDNLERVQSVYNDFKELVRKFSCAHQTYHANLVDEDDVQESEAYYSVEVRRTCAFKDKIDSWLHDNRICHEIGSKQLNEIRPSDSVSNVGTHASSKSSRKSRSVRSEIGSVNSRASDKASVLSAKTAAATARKAALEEEAKRLRRRQELQKQQLFLKLQMEELEGGTMPRGRTFQN